MRTVVVTDPPRADIGDAETLGGYGVATFLLALAVAAGGALWAWLYHRSGALYGPWLSHACADAGLMAIGYVLWRAVAP